MRLIENPPTGVLHRREGILVYGRKLDLLLLRSLLPSQFRLPALGRLPRESNAQGEIRSGLCLSAPRRAWLQETS